MLAFVLIVLAFAQALLGGFIGAQFATAACPSLPGCSGFRFDEWAAAITLDPFRPWQVANGRIVPVPGAAGLHVMHRFSGPVLVAGIAVLAWALRREEPRIALALVVLAIVAPALGGAAMLAMPSLPLTVLHNAVAAAIVALLAGVAIRR
jgi:heme A synthase